MLKSRPLANLLRSNLRRMPHTLQRRHYAIEELTMPALSPTMESGTLVKWHVNPGDHLSPGQVICSVQTDKAVVEMDTQEDVIFGKVLVQEGQEDVKLGEVIALVCDEDEDLDDIDKYKVEGTKGGSAADAINSTSADTSASSSAQASTTTNTQQQNSTSVPLRGMDPPSVRSFLDTYGIDRSVISSRTGKDGRLTKADVVAFQKTDKFQQLKKQPAKKPKDTKKTDKKRDENKSHPRQEPLRASSQNYLDIQTSPTRKVIASRLLESKQNLPHFYMSTEVRIDKLLAYRAQLKQQNVKASLNDFVIKMCARALEQVPQCNAIFNSKTGQHEVQEKIDVSVAVATDSGLITPIVKDANRKPVPTIASTVKELANRARSGGLKPEEFQGGTFCISNLGMYGIDNFEAVINPPHAMILAVGTSEKRPYLETEQEASDEYGFGQSFDLSVLDDVDPEQLNNGTGQPKTATYMSLSISADARAVDEGDVAKYLSVLKDLLEMRNYM